MRLCPNENRQVGRSRGSIQDIQLLAMSFERCLFNWVPREANVAANELGARAYSFSQLLFSGLLFLKPRIVLFCKSRILSSMKLIFVQKIIIIKCIERHISD